MKVKIKLKGKEVVIDDIKKASGIKKFSGLMFKGKQSCALLFSFNLPGKYSIHSFFCQPFLAIWLNEGKIVDYKMIGPNAVIKPEKDFTQLIEIPLNEKYRDVVNLFF